MILFHVNEFTFPWSHAARSKRGPGTSHMGATWAWGRSDDRGACFLCNTHCFFKICFQHRLLQEALPDHSSPKGTFRPPSPHRRPHPSKPSAKACNPVPTKSLPSSGGQEGLAGTTCDSLSILPSAPLRPGTQQVLGNWPSSCSCKRPAALSKPGQAEQSWLRAICFITPSTQLAPPV